MLSKKNNKGFTLIEVMISIMLLSIGILAATKMQQYSMIIDYQTSKYDEANRILASFCEDINLTDITDINALTTPILQPDDVNALKTQIKLNFDYNTALSFQTGNGIKIYQLVTKFPAQNYRQVELCAAWQTSGSAYPHFLHRTVIKPIASDS